MTLALVVSFLLQAEDVAKQAARVDPKDSHSSFDAISRLVNLSEKYRKEVEAAAEKWSDPFYRTVLLEELKARDRLGTRYGKESRITLQGCKLPSEYLDDYHEKLGVTVRARYVDAFEKEARSPLELKLEDVTPLDALRELCRQTKAVPDSPGLPTCITLSSNRRGGDGATAFRNFLVCAGSIRKVDLADFEGPPKRGVAIGLNLLWDRGIEIATVEEGPVVLEAVDEKGQALAPAQAGFLRSLEENDRRWGGEIELGRYWCVNVGLAPTKAEKIARLRGYVTLGVPVETSEFAFDKFEGGLKREDDHFEAIITGANPCDTPVLGAADTTVAMRLRPKKGTPEQAGRLATSLIVRFESGFEYPAWGVGRIEGPELVFRALSVSSSGYSHSRATGLTFRVHRVVAPRRLYFELTDIPLN